MSEQQRILSLSGTSNFRDLGGYATEDGRRVRWRVLYRSSHLSGLSGDGTAQFAMLGLKTICDLRHDEERKARPTPLACGTGCRVELLNLKAQHETSIEALIHSGSSDGFAARALMRAVYRAFPLDHAEVYAKLLERLADPSDLPLLFHCTAGRDRTGFGAALILRTLGVPMDMVMADYLLTNSHWRGTGILDNASPDIRLALGRANAEYLEASFRAIDERYGSLARYLEQALHFDRPRVAALRELLLGRDLMPG